LVTHLGMANELTWLDQCVRRIALWLLNLVYISLEHYNDILYTGWLINNRNTVHTVLEAEGIRLGANLIWWGPSSRSGIGPHCVLTSQKEDWRILSGLLWRH
jgi:hypothetical protein